MALMSVLASVFQLPAGLMHVRLQHFGTQPKIQCPALHHGGKYRLELNSENFTSSREKNRRNNNLDDLDSMSTAKTSNVSAALDPRPR